MVGRVFGRHIGRIKRYGIIDVGVLKIVQPVILHAGGDDYVFFGFVRQKIRRLGRLGTLVGAYFPIAAKRHKSAALRAVLVPFLLVRKRYIIASRRQCCLITKMSV